ncbi:helix-turn-helix domain-containing protein [Hutsoniella sourekii]
MENINKKLGASVKQMRVHKKIKQVDLPGLNYSASMISKQENGQQIFTVENLFKYSRALQSSPEEIIFISNDYQISKRRLLFNQLASIWNGKDYQSLNDLYRLSNQYAIQNSHDVALVTLNKYLKLYLRYTNQELEYAEYEQGLKEIARYIWEYLSGLKEFYLSDLRLINFSYYFLPVTEFKQLLPKIIDRFLVYCQEPNYQKDYVVFLLNASLFFIKYHDVQAARLIFDNMDQLDLKDLSVTHFLHLKVRQGIVESDEPMIAQAVEMAKLTNIKELVNQLYTEVLKFFPEYFIKHPEDFDDFEEKDEMLHLMQDRYWYF